jgi:hypothetical protein
MMRDARMLMALGLLGLIGLVCPARAEEQIYLNQGLFKTSFPITNDFAHQNVVPATRLITIVHEGVETAAGASTITASEHKIVLLDQNGQIPDPSDDRLASSNLGKIRIGRFLPELTSGSMVTEGTASIYLLPAIDENLLSEPQK